MQDFKKDSNWSAAVEWRTLEDIVEHLKKDPPPKRKEKNKLPQQVRQLLF